MPQEEKLEVGKHRSELLLVYKETSHQERRICLMQSTL
jgi:hypothetical protein